MLYEFAVEPGALASWQTCRYVLDQMGVSHGRMLSAFPKRKQWKELVRKACEGLPDRDKKRIIEKLENVNTLMLPARRPYDPSRLWMANALEQQGIDPFHAIIARNGDPALPFLLAADDVHASDPLWNVRREDTVPRQARDLARFVKPLLQISSEIRFVDKLFDPVDRWRKWLPMLEHCVSAAVDGGRELSKLEYHTVITGGKRPPLDAMKRSCLARLPGILPSGIRLRVVLWRLPGDEDSKAPGEHRELLHARYILTNRGGYRVETGLDVGSPGQHQDVSLLDSALHAKRWAELNDGAGVFEFADEVLITKD